MALFVFGDECGHSNIERPDPNFPVFVFCVTMCRTQSYERIIVPAFDALKTKHLGSTDPILHSRSIRKSIRGFECLKEPGCWETFDADLRETVRRSPFEVIASGIKILEHSGKYVTPIDPYHLSMEFILEKVLTYVNQTGERHVHFVLESRGGKHDNALRKVFDEFLEKGTRYRSPEKFKAAKFTIRFAPKQNVIGTQISDLMAYPIGQNILTPGYRAFLGVHPKIYHPEWMDRYKGERGEDYRYGLKIFP